MKTIKLFSSETYPATPGVPVQFSLQQFTPKIGRFFAHVAAVGIRVNATVANAASGAAVSAAYTGALLQQVTVARNPTERQVDAVPGDALINRESVKNGGVLPFALTAIAAGGSGGSTTALVNEDFWINLDEAHAADQADITWPLLSYQPSGYVSVTLAPIAGLQASLSYSGTPTVQLVLLCTLKDYPILGADCRIQYLSDTLNVAAGNTRTGWLHDEGVYRRILLDSPSASGFPAPAAQQYSAIGSINQPIRFPSSINMTSVDYNDQYLITSGAQNSSSAGNIVTSGQVAVLVSPAGNRGKTTESAFFASTKTNFQLQLAASGAGGAGVSSHRLVYERVYRRDAQQALAIAAAGKLGKVSAVQRTATTRPVSDADRTAFIPIELRPAK